MTNEHARGVLAPTDALRDRRPRRAGGIVTAFAVSIATLVWTGVAGASSSSATDVSGGRIHLDAPIRMIDNRAGSPTTSLHIGAGLLTVQIFGEAQVTLHPCSRGAAPGDPLLVAGFGYSGVTSIATADATCATSPSPFHAIVDRFGTVTATPVPGGLQYVPSTPSRQLTAGTATGVTSVPVGSVPNGAAAAVVLVEVVADDLSSGYVVIGACPSPGFAAVLGTSSVPSAVVVTVPIDANGDICIDDQLTNAALDLELLGVLATAGPDPSSLPPAVVVAEGNVPPPGLVPVGPERILDTRNGTGWYEGKVFADEIVELDVLDVIGPTTTALALNVTVDQPEGTGFVTVWPCDAALPDASNLNVVSGRAVANAVVAAISADAYVCIRSTVDAHLIADVTARYDIGEGSLATPLAPSRMLDTRNGTGVSRSGVAPAGSITEVVVSATSPPAYPALVTVNATVVDARDGGFLTIFPCDQDLPVTSNLNFRQGDTIANHATVAMSPMGTICIYTSAATHLLADLSVRYDAQGTAGLSALVPDRFLDTRSGVGVGEARRARAEERIVLQIGARASAPGDASAAILNVTIDQPDRDGFATVWPCDQPLPVASNLNFRAGQTVPNLVTAKLAADGTLCIMSTAEAHVLADVAGVLSSDPVPGLVVELR
jgi:hypothetical protein